MSLQHSAIIGFAYDNHPIYGKYGFADPTDINSAVVELLSSYQLKTVLPPSRPSITTYPLGTLAEDYEYISNGVLDEHNGRFAVTPEYPQGIYAYVGTTDFPYFIGSTYKDPEDQYNKIKQENNAKLPLGSTRILLDGINVNTPSPRNSIESEIVEVAELSRGIVEKIDVEIGGYNYKVGDRVEFEGNKAPIGEVEWLGGNISTFSITGNVVQVSTMGNHQLQTADEIEVLESPIKSTNIISHNIVTDQVIKYNNDNIHRLVLPLNSEYNGYSVYLSEDMDGQVVYTDLDIERYINPFNSNCKSIIIYPGDRPQVLFVNVAKNTIKRSLNVCLILNKTQHIGKYKVEVINPTTFSYTITPGLDGNLVGTRYITNSLSAVGEISKVKTVYGGTNLSELPKVTKIISNTGYGAILVPKSTSIGEILKVAEISNGDYYPGDPTLEYKVNTDVVLEIKYNNTIDRLTVLNGGSGYLIAPIAAGMLLRIENGVVVSGKVLDGGKYYESSPLLNIDNTLSGGSGAVVRGILKKNIIQNYGYIYYGTSPTNWLVKAQIIHYDINASTLQVRPIVGDFNSISAYEYIWDELGNKIGQISKVITSEIVKRSVAGKLAINNNPNGRSNLVSSNVLHNNDKYQAYSYTINSQHNLDEYKDTVVLNTHPAGMKLTAITQLENIIKLYTRSQDKIKNSVSFRVILNDLLELPTTIDKVRWYLNIHSNPDTLEKNTQFAKKMFDFCYYDKKYVYSTGKTFNKYRVGDKIWLTETYYRYILEKINPRKVLTSARTILRFPIHVRASNDNSIFTYAGVIQHPVTNYNAYSRIIELNSDILYENDRAVLKIYKDNIFTYTDKLELVANVLELKDGGVNYTPVDPTKLIVLVDGVPINPIDYNITGNTVTFNSVSTYPNSGFAIYNENLVLLDITAVTNQVYTVNNHTIEDSSKLLVVVNGVLQYTPTINTGKIVLSTTEPVVSIFAYYVETESVDVEDVYEILNGNSANNVIDAVLTPIFSAGKLKEIIISNTGINYPRFLRFDIIDTNGVGAWGVCETEYSRITKIRIISGGSGYTYGKIRISQMMSVETSYYPNIQNISDIPETLPAITGSILASPNLVERGSIITSVMLDWHFSRIPSNSVSITDLTTVDKNILTDSITLDYTSAPIVDDKLYEMTILDGTDTYTFTDEIKFLSKLYLAKSPFNTLTGAQIIGFASDSYLVDSFVGEYSWTGLVNDYIYISYPSTFGFANFTFSGFPVTFTQYNIVNFTNSSGYTSSYVVYRSLNQLNGNVTLQLS
jgi:hypothetical protein